MDFSSYQHQVNLLKRYKEKNFGPLYPYLKLSGEAGETSEKIGKLIRDFDWDGETDSLTEEQRVGLLKELGDVLWYVAAIADDLKSSLGQVASMNMTKLNDRKDRGVLHGSGDDR